MKQLKTPDLESIKKHIKKEYSNWTDAQIELKSQEILAGYLESNKEKIDKEIQEDKDNLEIALDKEFINLFLDLKSDDWSNNNKNE
ncbi:hypothetical protein ACST14_06350 [Aquirufa sp. A-Brett2-15D]